MIIVTVIMVVLGLSGYAVLSKISQHLVIEQQHREVEAAKPAIARAKEECLKANQPIQVCSSITGTASEGDCSGRVCWILNAFSKNPYDYNASIVVDHNSKDGYVVSEYRAGVFSPSKNQ